MTKKKGRPKKQSSSIDIEKTLLELSFLISGDPLILNELRPKLSSEELLLIQSACSEITHLFETISEIYGREIGEIKFRHSNQKFISHWLLNRYFLFRFLRNKYAYGDTLEKAFNLYESPSLQWIKRIILTDISKKFSLKGGPKPLKENLLFLRILDQIFLETFPKNNMKRLYETVYCDKAKAVFKSLNMDIPDFHAFEGHMSNQSRTCTINIATGLFSNQDMHVLFLPLLISALGTENDDHSLSLEAFKKHPIIKNEGFFLKQLTDDMISDFIQTFSKSL